MEGNKKRKVSSDDKSTPTFPILKPKPEPLDEPIYAEPSISSPHEPENPRDLVPFQQPPRVPSKTRSSELVRLQNPAECHLIARHRVRKTLILYHSVVCSLLAEYYKRLHDGEIFEGRRRIDLKSATLLRENDHWLNREKRYVGQVPGIHIGDVFFYRAELCVVGLHGHIQGGIDYLSASESPTGEPVATSVVVSGGYEDDEDSGDVIIYTGQGGQTRQGRQVASQSLESGNLALDRSMCYEVEVRVIRGLKSERSPSGKVYVYDGLYRVVKSWFDTGLSGFQVYKFRLERIEGQEEMGSGLMRLATSLKDPIPVKTKPKGYISLDLSDGKEIYPVKLYNDVDSDCHPLRFQYIASTIFPPFLRSADSLTGCDCVEICVEGCFCSTRNGGEFPYGGDGLLIRGKPVVFECGPGCKCSRGCSNRVAQNGITNHFEVFRTKDKKWGLRSLDVIPAGSFICNYSGVCLTNDQVRIFTMNGDNLVYPSRFSERWREWGDLSELFKDYAPPDVPSIPPLDYAMDVSRVRNFASYIGHSSSPNAMVQHVLYDHGNACFPYMMVFAMENIPPMREITLDYGTRMGADDCKVKRLAICNNGDES